jgi:ketosteroid isomerase-like protein
MAIARVALFSLLLLLAGNVSSYAQQSAVDQVKAAIDAFHAALGSLDVAKMAPLWVHEASVVLVNPRDKTIAVGWPAVSKDWEATFAANAALTVTQAAGPYVHVAGNIAWSIGIANAVIKLKSGQTINAPTYETDIFENRGGRWLLVSHVALRVPR